MRKLLTLLVFIFSLTITVKAQWYKLQAYTNTLLGTGGIAQYSYPVNPLVAGNGVIVYGVFGQTSSSQNYLDIAESIDDLDHINKIDHTYTLGFQAIASKNDSTFCFVNFGFNNVDLYYTHNNLTNISTSPALNIPEYPSALPMCFSNNFIYLAWEGNKYVSSNVFRDSLILLRINPVSMIDTEYINNTYALPNVVSFTSDSVGYLSCALASDTSVKAIIKTADSGKTWTSCFIDSIHYITDFYFPTPNIGYLTESNGAVYKTANAGKSWTKLVSPTSIQLNCVSFANDSVGYVGGNSGVLYKTINGGQAWTNANSGITNTIVALYTFGDSIAYFKDAGNSLYKNVSPLGIETLNGGNNVIDIYPNPSNGKFSVAIKNYELGITNSIEVYNMLGERIIPSSVIRNSQFVIDLSGQPNGVYFYRITNNTAQAMSGKIIVQH